MNRRERYIETIKFGKPDRIPLHPGWPRESTLAAWRGQGLDEGADFVSAAQGELGIPHESYIPFCHLHVNFGMIPEYEVKILEHRDGHYVISDHMGAITEISDAFDASYLRSAKDFVTRKWHKFPVETREDWKKMMLRYDPKTPGRVSESAALAYEKNKGADVVYNITFNGVFWQLREWCGMENLCMLMLDDPVLVDEMSEFWREFVLEVFELMFGRMIPDRALINEDMAYKAHSMISPAMTRRFILPAYRKWVARLKRGGASVIEVDSDGHIGELIPLWIEEGIDCCSPLEVAAGNDIVDFRRRFGKNMAFMQGIDKRVIARGKAELERHVDEIVPPLFKDGGFIPGCDHGVPPDISWPNYVEFVRLLAKKSGWL